MPPPKIIGQVLQKKILWKKFKEEKRRKNNVAKEKKNTFLFEILAAYTTRYSPEDPLRAKKRTKSPSLSSSNLSHWCYYFMKEKKAYLQQVHVVKALLLTYSNPPRGARNNWRKFVFCLNQVYKKNQCLLLPWISVSKKRTTVNSLSWNSYKSVKQKNYD